MNVSIYRTQGSNAEQIWITQMTC